MSKKEQFPYQLSVNMLSLVSIHEYEHKPKRIGREQYVQLIALKSSNLIMFKPIKEPHNKPYFKFNQSIHNLTLQKQEMSSNLILRALQKQQNVGTVMTPNKIETILGVLLSILEVYYNSFSDINLAFCF
ncbi:unnamed protein product [Paramecium pentaurelia]|uniref:Uncharacterized protein n=1 Tax=Paramecium pentaurelia TaxID=43138 RepID=A0A8S1UZF0_9CILI|nr:unnamed protein product [Paramecium pentaurelia]